MAFLERVKEDFNRRYGGGKAATAQPNSLNKEFGYFCLINSFFLLLLKKILLFSWAYSWFDSVLDCYIGRN